MYLTLNIISIIALLVLLSVYGRVIYYEAHYAVSSLFSKEIKESQRYYDDLPRDVAAGNQIELKPIVKIPQPKDPDFSVVITKLGINQRVIKDVDVNDKKQVNDALKKGIGWAKGTVEPGQDGNSLLFSHSTQNAWDIWRYNSEFTLLRKLEINDMFTVVYQGRQMDFMVFEKKVVPANDKSYLTSVAEGKVVTLQTCHPPGSNTERLLIRGRLVAMQLK